MAIENHPNSGVIQEITPLSARDSFYIVDRYKKEFTYPIHKHEECELNFLTGANGAFRVVGDSTETVDGLDLVLITGKELEHAWIQGNCQSSGIHEITIQFQWDMVDNALFNRSQFDSIRKMMEEAKKGLAFSMQSIVEKYHLLEEVVKEKDGFYSVIKLLTLLHELSLCNDTRTLASSAFAHTEPSTESRRVQKVQRYINEHYQENIHLSHMAMLVNMAPAAFSRFFKLRTGKSLTDYIIDIRIGHATRMLVDTTNTIAEIGYNSGFNNLSNFNRIFKKKKDCSPKEFREHYRKKKVIR